MADIIYVLFLGYESARNAIADLIEFQPTRDENIIVILMTELVCFSFLCEYLKNSEMRLKGLERHELVNGGKNALKFRRLCEEFEVKFERLELREGEYKKIVPALNARVTAPHGESQKKYWEPAKRTLPELQKR